MITEREAYKEARENFKNEVYEKYGFFEVSKSDNHLSLSNEKVTFHLVFFLPDGDDLIVSDFGESFHSGNSFMHYVSLKSKSTAEMITTLKKLFSGQEMHDFTSNAIYNRFQLKFNFLCVQFPEVIPINKK